MGKLPKIRDRPTISVYFMEYTTAWRCGLGALGQDAALALAPRKPMGSAAGLGRMLTKKGKYAGRPVHNASLPPISTNAVARIGRSTQSGARADRKPPIMTPGSDPTRSEPKSPQSIDPRIQ